MTVKVYRKKPILIKAVLWDGSREAIDDIHTLLNENPTSISNKIYKEDRILFIPTLEGEMSADYGDYIIQGIAGELYPCKPEIFKATYEAV